MSTTLKNFFYNVIGVLAFCSLGCKDSKIIYLVGKATTADQNQNYKQALKYYSEALQLDSINVPVLKSMAMDEVMLEDDKSALIYVEKAIRISPRLSSLYIYRGDCRPNSDTVERLADYTKAIELDNNAGYAYTERADIELAKKDTEAALRDYNIGLKNDSINTGFAFPNRGWIEMGRHLYKQALIDFNKAIKLHPTFSGAYHDVGFADMSLHDTLGALMAFNNAIEHGYSNKTNDLCNRAEIKLMMKDTTGAIEDFNRAIKLDSNSSLAYSERGYIEYCQHKYKISIKDYNTSLILSPNEKRFFYHRGLDYIKMGNKVSGCKDFYKAKELGDNRADSVLKIYCK